VQVVAGLAVGERHVGAWTAPGSVDTAFVLRSWRVCLAEWLGTMSCESLRYLDRNRAQSRVPLDLRFQSRRRWKRDLAVLSRRGLLLLLLLCIVTPASLSAGVVTLLFAALRR
jgi:hypothetical protein